MPPTRPILIRLALPKTFPNERSFWQLNDTLAERPEPCFWIVVVIESRYRPQPVARQSCLWLWAILGQAVPARFTLSCTALFTHEVPLFCARDLHARRAFAGNVLP